jgi:hypothetical protein
LFEFARKRSIFRLQLGAFALQALILAFNEFQAIPEDVRRPVFVYQFVDQTKH